MAEKFTLDWSYLRWQVSKAVRSFFMPLRVAWRMMVRTTEPVADGEDDWSEWIHPLPGYRMGCCDCGLVHEMQVAITEANDDYVEGDYNLGEGADSVVVFRMRRA